MKREFKAHPLMIFTFLQPFLFVLLIPVARGVVQYLRDGEITQVLGVEMILFVLIVFFAVVRWRSFRLVCDGKTVYIRDGIILVKKAVIPIERLSSVQSRQNPIDYIFRCVTYNINTEAGRRGRTDYSFKLSRHDSIVLSDLLYGKNSGEPMRFSPVKIAILAVATSSAFTGMVVGVPVLNNAAKLLGLGFNEIFDEINSVSSKFQTYFPPIVNTLTVILLAGYVISFVYSFLRYLSFRLYMENDRIEIRSGFFVRFRTSFRKSSVNNLKIEQTFFMRLLRRYAMKANVGGYGESKSESQVLAPSGRYAELKALFSDCFPSMRPTGRRIGSKIGAIHKNRYLYWAEVYFVILMVFAVVSVHFFREFGSFILFSTVIISAAIFYYAYLCAWEYKNCCVSFDQTVYAKGVKGLRSCRIYCSKDRVGEIKLSRYLTDPMYKTCNIKITVRSETADTITVRHLDYTETLNEIYKCYGITE